MEEKPIVLVSMENYTEHCTSCEEGTMKETEAGEMYCLSCGHNGGQRNL